VSQPAGYGKAGYCAICASPNAAEYIKGARSGGKSGRGWNSAEFNVHAETNGEHWSRQTYYSHRDHSQTAEMRVIQTSQALKESAGGGVAIKKSSNTELLEAIRDIGMAKALRSPDEVSIDHSLKAVSILEGRKDKGSDSLNILVAFITGNPPPVVIEGVSRDVTEETLA
jgi:hypothetical protein